LAQPFTTSTCTLCVPTRLEDRERAFRVGVTAVQTGGHSLRARRARATFLDARACERDVPGAGGTMFRNVPGMFIEGFDRADPRARYPSPGVEAGGEKVHPAPKCAPQPRSFRAASGKNGCSAARRSSGTAVRYALRMTNDRRAQLTFAAGPSDASA